MTQAARHLYAVKDRVADENGELVSPEQLVAEIEKLRVDLKMAQRDVKSKNRRINELEFNAAQDRLTYPRRADVERIFDYWRRKTGHAKAALTPLRFDAIRGILDQQNSDIVNGRRVKEPAYTLEQCKLAVDGLAFDHFSKPRKNGSVQVFDDVELAFRDGKHFEEFVKKAPKPVKPRPQPERFVTDWT
jgi:hypothetical protein